MRKARLLPSASLASPRLASGSASSSARPSAGPRGVLTVAGVMRPWRCFGEGSDPQRHIFFKLEDGYFTVWCWFLPHISMDQPYVSQALPPHPSPRGCAEPCVSSPSHRAHSPASVLHELLWAFPCYSAFVPPSPPLCVHKAALYEGHTVSVSLGSVVSAWPRAQRRCSGNKEGN